MSETTIWPEVDWERKMSDVRFFIEATDYEITMLHEMMERECPKTRMTRETLGFSQVIGMLDGRPVNLSFTFGTVNGMPVAYWSCISQVVDHAMIEKWFEDNYCPYWDGGTRRANTNPMNFHFVLEASEDQ